MGKESHDWCESTATTSTTQMLEEGLPVRRVGLKPLTSTAEKLEAVQRVLEAAPAYGLAVQGSPLPPENAAALFTSLPPGVDRSAKSVFGIFLDDEMIGCIDVVRGYPSATCSMIGLLLIAEEHQGRGLGSSSLRLFENVARGWSCDTLRIGVVASNDKALGFWRAAGFLETGETRPWTEGSVISEVITMEKVI